MITCEKKNRIHIFCIFDWFCEVFSESQDEVKFAKQSDEEEEEKEEEEIEEEEMEEEESGAESPSSAIERWFQEAFRRFYLSLMKTSSSRNNDVFR